MTERREGTRRLYRAKPETVAALRAFLDDFWTSGLARLRDAAEAAEPARTGPRADRPAGRGTAGDPNPHPTEKGSP